MRRTLLVGFVFVLAGCGAAPRPDYFSLVVDYFRPLASCYADGTAPVEGVRQTAPTLIEVQVWDGPDGSAYLDVLKGDTTMDMGDAPGVVVGGIFSGTKGATSWSFKSETVEVTEPANATVTVTRSATFVFERKTTFHGTLSLSSVRSCLGTACAGLDLGCTIADIAFAGTQTPAP
jgi:hypothetical protein